MSPKADIEEPISLVSPGHAKIIQAVLNRAHAREISAGAALTRSAGNVLRPTSSKGVLSQALGLALAHNGGPKKGGPSLRPKAPDTNGRSFHFAYSTVNKEPSSSEGKGSGAGSKKPGPKPAEATGPSSNGSNPSAGSGSISDASADGSGSKLSQTGGELGSKEAGHQRYLERDSASPQDADKVFGIPVSGRGGLKIGIFTESGRERDLAAEREPAVVEEEKSIEIDIVSLEKKTEQAAHDETQSASAAQRYIENPSKIVAHTRHGNSNSFGTIGETFEDRVRFWEDVDKHERKKNARTQIRLVLELPHEASPEARQEIVVRFCKQYENLSVPYWAAIHAPTNENDSRNFHAHIVHLNRPASIMSNPANGEMAWDFTITKRINKQSRNYITTYPYRQNVAEEFRDREYVSALRNHFANTVNEVLKKHSCEVRYDARSYKEMGLDIQPMKNISRVVSDKSKSQDFVVIDAERTRRLIDQGMRDAAIERDRTYSELKAVDKWLATVSDDVRSLSNVNAKLPKSMQLSPMSRLSVEAAKRITQLMLKIEQEKIAQRFADETAARTIQHIIDKTAPVSAQANGKPRSVRLMPDGFIPPSPEVLRLLHASATEEMRLHRIATAERAKKLAWMATGALAQWQEQAQPKPPLVPHLQPVPPAARTTRQVHWTAPRNMLEVIERTSLKGTKFPQSMHDYANARNAESIVMFSSARAAGPEALKALLESIRLKTECFQSNLAQSVGSQPAPTSESDKPRQPTVINPRVADASGAAPELMRSVQPTPISKLEAPSTAGSPPAVNPPIAPNLEPQAKMPSSDPDPREPEKLLNRAAERVREREREAAMWQQKDERRAKREALKQAEELEKKARTAARRQARELEEAKQAQEETAKRLASVMESEDEKAANEAEIKRKKARRRAIVRKKNDVSR